MIISGKVRLRERLFDFSLSAVFPLKITTPKAVMAPTGGILLVSFFPFLDRKLLGLTGLL